VWPAVPQTADKIPRGLPPPPCCRKPASLPGASHFATPRLRAVSGLDRSGTNRAYRDSVTRRADLETTARVDITLLYLAAREDDARHSALEVTATMPIRRAESHERSGPELTVTGTEGEATARVAVDVEAAFAEESGTKPMTAPDGCGGEEVDVLLPLDAVPVLRVPRDEVPWQELGELATRLLLRVDGAACMMLIVSGAQAAPNDAARELAKLVRRGLLGMKTPFE
jgi:hypothetical protein